jgi:hypothetical protein
VTKPLFVRPSPALRALVDTAGPPTDAARALLLLGAAVAGLDVADVRGDAGRLLAVDLDPRVVAALNTLFFSAGPASTVASGRASSAASAPPEVPLITLADLDAQLPWTSDHRAPALDDDELGEVGREI